MLGLVHIFNYSDISKLSGLSILFGNDAAFAFLPAVYGEDALVQQTRKEILSFVQGQEEGSQ